MVQHLPGEALSETDRDLVDAARRTIDAHTDAGPDEDGTYTMGAAVRDVDGQVTVGVNLYHFTGGPCAELVALGAARAGGSRTIETIVAVGNHGRGVVGPCGRDRQVLLDLYPGIRVVLPVGDELRAVRIEELVPWATGWSAEGGSVPLSP